MATLTDRSSSYKFRYVKIGSGGWMMSLAQSNDGQTLVCGGDVYGAYKYNFTASRWEQLFNTARLPAVLHDPNNSIDEGCLGIVPAPNNASIIYMLAAGYCLKSTDSGATFAITGFPRMTHWEPNAQPFRIDGPRIAVDPQNANHVLVGTQRDGLWRTTDGGTNWTQQTGVPAAATDRMRGIIVAFAKVGTVSGGLQTIAYAGSQGNGVYKFNGTAWSSVTGTPLYPSNIAVAIDDEVFVCAYTGGNNTKSANITRITPAGAVSTIGPNLNRGPHCALPHPSDASRLIAISEGGHMAQTNDRGTTWSAFSSQDAVVRRSTTAPWMVGTNENYMSTAAGLWQRDNAGTVTGRIMIANGINVWESTNAVAAGTVAAPAIPTPDWSDRGEGIELMVANEIKHNGSGILLSLWDRPFFRITNPAATVAPSQHGVANWQTHSIIHGWSNDFAKVAIGTDAGESITDPKQVVIAIADDYHIDQSGYSLDGGATWTKFATMPNWLGTATDNAYKTGFGTLAASTSKNFIWGPANSGQPTDSNGNPIGNLRKPYYTLDRGATWSPIGTLPGVTDDHAGWRGYHFAYYLKRHVICADAGTDPAVSANVFYLVLDNSTATVAGVFKTVNGGATWTRQYTGRLGNTDSAFNADLKAVPGRSGHLIFTAGHVGSSTAGNLQHSTDGGATWRNIPDVLEAYDFAIGPVAPGGSYNRVSFTGWLNGTAVSNFGTYYSDNFDLATPSWSKMCQFPAGHLDAVVAMGAHPTNADELYLGFDGSTLMYSSLSGLELGPTLYSDPDTFYAATLTGGGPRTLQPSLYSDPDTFYAATVARALRPGGRLRLH